MRRRGVAGRRRAVGGECRRVQRVVSPEHAGRAVSGMHVILSSPHQAQVFMFLVFFCLEIEKTVFSPPITFAYV